MRLAQIQFVSWDKAYNFYPNGINLEKGDKVVVKTDLGLEVGEVAGFVDVEAVEKEGKLVAEGHSCNGCANGERTGECSEKEIKPVLRLATQIDLDKKVGEDEKEKALELCKEVAERLELAMKIVDAHFSFDGSRLTFAFIADGRVDFRELVKELTRHFNRTIRLQQIGIRDEAKFIGDYGHCGRSLCCKGFLTDLVSITSEMADIQQCAHRGSDRLSGSCGRLMCCLAYEEKGYADMQKAMPPVGTKVNVDGKKGVVLSHHVLKQSVDVEFPGEKEGEGRIVAEVDLNRNKGK